MAKKFGLYDQFEIRGYWWLPSKPDQRIAGILSYGMDGINLELFGHLKESEEIERKTSKFDIVLGQTEKGKITLHDGFQTKMKMSIITSTHLTFNILLIGKHFCRQEEIKFHSVYINYSYLEEWLLGEPITVESDWKDDKLIQKITYDITTIFEIEIESISATIKADNNINSSSKKISYDHSNALCIIPSKNQDLIWFLNITGEIRYMLSLLMNRPVYPKRFTAKGDLISMERRESIEIFILPMPEFKEKDIHFTDRYVSYNLIKDNISNIFSNWFTKKDIESSKNIFLRNIYSTYSDRESLFLNYAKSIESFHRDTSGETGKFLTDKDYAKIKQQMISAIPNEINKDLKNKLVSTLNYAHHFGFRRRVIETLNKLPDVLQNAIFEDTKKLKGFASDVTNTRDYYTHIGDKPDYYFIGWDLHLANKRMHTFLFYHLCNQIGIKDDVLIPVILQNDGLVEWLEKAKQELKN